MKTYDETIEELGELKFMTYMSGAMDTRTDEATKSIVAFIYNKDDLQVDADINSDFDKVRNAYFGDKK